MDNYDALHEEYVQKQILTATEPKSLQSTTTIINSRPSTASRSANAIIKEASAYAACSELLLPSIIGTDGKLLSALVSAALETEIDPTTTTAVETSTGLYVSCRVRQTREQLFVIFKGRQFLAPSSTELQNILDEAMALMVLRRSDDGAAEAMSKRFPIAAQRDLYRCSDRIVVVTLVKDHLESCFQRSSPEQFHYQVRFSDLWSSNAQFHFFSLRHFTEAVEQGELPVTHGFRSWLFLFAYQSKLQSTCMEGNERLQRICDEAISDESIAMAWEKTAELSRAPLAY